MYPQHPQEHPRQLRGLYRHVKISVHTLNIVIVVGILALVIAVIWALITGGYHVTFDSQGGTDVVYQELRYGDLIDEPEAPTREGYTFDGWYQDENYSLPWNFDTDLVNGDLTLYAKWVSDS